MVQTYKDAVGELRLQNVEMLGNGVWREAQGDRRFSLAPTGGRL